MALQTRRMRRNAVMLSIQQQNNINHRKRKTMWVYPRPQFWFEQLVVNHYQDHIWREHFRVSRETSMVLAEELDNRFVQEGL